MAKVTESGSASVSGRSGSAGRGCMYILHSTVRYVGEVGLVAVCSSVLLCVMSVWVHVWFGFPPQKPGPPPSFFPSCACAHTHHSHTPDTLQSSPSSSLAGLVPLVPHPPLPAQSPSQAQPIVKKAVYHFPPIQNPPSSLTHFLSYKISHPKSCLHLQPLANTLKASILSSKYFPFYGISLPTTSHSGPSALYPSYSFANSLCLCHNRHWPGFFSTFSRCASVTKRVIELVSLELSKLCHHFRTTGWPLPLEPTTTHRASSQHSCLSAINPLTTISHHSFNNHNAHICRLAQTLQGMQNTLCDPIPSFNSQLPCVGMCNCTCDPSAPHICTHAPATRYHPICPATRLYGAVAGRSACPHALREPPAQPVQNASVTPLRKPD